LLSDICVYKHDVLVQCVLCMCRHDIFVFIVYGNVRVLLTFSGFCFCWAVTDHILCCYCSLWTRSSNDISAISSGNVFR